MKKFGIIGSTLTHSKSPQMQLAGLKYLGIDGSYEKFEIDQENFEFEITGLIRSLDGLNITIPYKEMIIKYLNIVDPLVERIGAANTIEVRDGKIYGFNTDYYGFKKSLENYDLKNSQVSILGSGGASKAIIAALEDIGVSTINVYVRNLKKASESLPNLARRSINIKLFTEQENLSDSKLIVNCTPVGQGRLSEGLPLSINQINELKPDTIVYDLIYEKTKLLKASLDRGLRAIDGSDMLILQGVQSLSIWTKCNIDEGLIEAMKQGFFKA